MAPIANQTLEAKPNVLRGGSVPNTLGGVGPSQMAVKPRNSRRLYVAAVSAAVAAAALVLLAWRP